MDMQEDISKKTVVLLLVFTVVVSGLSTWMVISSTSSHQSDFEARNLAGNVKLNIFKSMFAKQSVEYQPPKSAAHINIAKKTV
jgi:hypothetical protein